MADPLLREARLEHEQNLTWELKAGTQPGTQEDFPGQQELALFLSLEQPVKRNGVFTHCDKVHLQWILKPHQP